MEIMLDIETLSSRPKALVTQVAAVVFDNDQILSSYNDYVDIDHALRNNAVVDKDALLFTIQHNQQSVINDYEKVNMKSVIARFDSFIKNSGFDMNNEDHKIWAYGPQFDCNILESWYIYFNRQVPWFYRQVRDLRTLVKETKNIDVNKIEELKTNTHNALEDCMSQIKMLQYVRSIT